MLRLFLFLSCFIGVNRWGTPHQTSTFAPFCSGVDSFFFNVASFCTKFEAKSIKRDSFCSNVDSFFLKLESFCSAFGQKSIKRGSFFLNVESFCSGFDSFSINVGVLKWRGVHPKWGYPPPMYP